MRVTYDIVFVTNVQ